MTLENLVYLATSKSCREHPEIENIHWTLKIWIYECAFFVPIPLCGVVHKEVFCRESSASECVDPDF